MPSPSSEYAHPDVVIGLTVLAYRYEGLRRTDFEEILSQLYAGLTAETGEILERPSALRWRTWVEDAGGLLCTKQKALQEAAASGPSDDPVAIVREASGSLWGLQEDKGPKRRVLPLHLLERTNEGQMASLFQMLRTTPSVVEWYLDTLIFPAHLRFQVRVCGVG